MKASKEKNPPQKENHSYSRKNGTSTGYSVSNNVAIDRLLRMCQIKPKWLLEAKIASYKLYDTSFPVSLILKKGWVSDDVSLLT